jgi:adenylate kinase family enzyme
MKRVLVIGSPGTGKSTFARRLAAKTGLPLMHLDLYYHEKSQNYYVDKDAWTKRVRELVAQPQWIVDGNHGRSMRMRMERADTIIHFDLPRRSALRGVVKRRAQAHKTKRADMPDDWEEKLSWEFLRYVWKFRKTYRASTLQLLAENADKQIVTFKTRKQAEDFLKLH